MRAVVIEDHAPSISSFGGVIFASPTADCQ
jgi:hypothetical protein